MKIDIDLINGIAITAGEAILKIYSDHSLSSVVDYKSDNSPLTMADKKSHEIIHENLSNYDSSIPIISEESEVPAYEIRSHYDYYWIVDPLDGTKEFINRNGEFTVNIALIYNKQPILGVVYTPVINTLYYSFRGKSYKKDRDGGITTLSVNNKADARVAVRSKSHPSPEEEVVFSKYSVTDSISIGSSLKFCMVAEGKADLYYRHGPTMEWDTAAGQAVLEGAGGKVFKNTGPEYFEYNKENLLNGSFLALGFPF